MTTTTLRTAVLAVLSAVAPFATLAQQTPLAACRLLKEPTARLTCYDAIPLGAPPAASAGAAPVAASTPPAPPSPPLAPAATFGLERQAASAQPDSMQSSIVGRFEGWSANSKITLANGQVWQVSDGSRGVYNLMNPKVSVVRGFMGAFYLELEGANAAPRVRRLQ